MINSRKIEDLHPKVQALAKAFIARAKQAGIEVLITSTYRDSESQDALYAIGRTVPGRKVTNARAGQSMHNYRLAFDFVPLVHGKPSWSNTALWTACGEIAESVGLEWAGRWTTFKEFPHCQFTGGLTIAQLQKGAKL